MVRYSLGAHVAGAAGFKYSQLNNGIKFKQIVGLDAAGVHLTHFHADSRLTEDEAQKVIAIYSSDVAHFPFGLQCKGWYNEYGHLDVYICTYHITDPSSGQLLGSGAWVWRNRHDYANKIYRMLAEDTPHSYAKEWTWDEASQIESVSTLVRDAGYRNWNYYCRELAVI